MPPSPDPDFFTEILPIMLMSIAGGVLSIVAKFLFDFLLVFLFIGGVLFLIYLFFSVLFTKIGEKASATIAEWQGGPAEEMVRTWPEFILLIIGGVFVLGVFLFSLASLFEILSDERNNSTWF